MISLIFLCRFSLIFKLIFVLAFFFHFSANFLNFSCINFCSLNENFEAGMKIREAEAEKERKIRNVAKIRYVTKIRYLANSQVKKKKFVSKKKLFFLINYFILFIIKKNRYNSEFSLLQRVVNFLCYIAEFSLLQRVANFRCYSEISLRSENFHYSPLFCLLILF